MIGYMGLGLLVVGYITLLTKRSWLFIIINTVASVLLIFHAVTIQDTPFIIVNVFVALILIAEFFQERTWLNFRRKKKSN